MADCAPDVIDDFDELARRALVLMRLNGLATLGRLPSSPGSELAALTISPREVLRDPAKLAAYWRECAKCGHTHSKSLLAARKLVGGREL